MGIGFDHVMVEFVWMLSNQSGVLLSLCDQAKTASKLKIYFLTVCQSFNMLSVEIATNQGTKAVSRVQRYGQVELYFYTENHHQKSPPTFYTGLHIGLAYRKILKFYSKWLI